MKQQLFRNASLICFACTVLLSGCGGGGGSTPSAASEPTYLAGSVERSVFDQLNTIRLNGGFGMLVQDVALDKAAQSHADYVKTNYATLNTSGAHSRYSMAPAIYAVDQNTGWLTAHVEKAGSPGFSGVLPVDRIAAAGARYSYSGEVMAFNSPGNCLSGDLDTVFHRGPLLNPRFTSIGMGLIDLMSSQDMGICVFEPAYKTAPNRIPAGWTGVYPTDHQLNVPRGMPLGEAPDPAVDIPKELKGYPVSIYMDSDIKTIDTFTLTAAGASAAMPVKLLLKADFPDYIPTTEAHILPRQPLAPVTTYNVAFKATLVNGQTVTKNWSFSTR